MKGRGRNELWWNLKGENRDFLQNNSHSGPAVATIFSECINSRPNFFHQYSTIKLMQFAKYQKV